MTGRGSTPPGRRMDGPIEGQVEGQVEGRSGADLDSADVDGGVASGGRVSLPAGAGRTSRIQTAQIGRTTGDDAAGGAGEGMAGLARSSALMASGTLVSRVLGMVRVILQAAVIGLMLPANAWTTANTLPNLIYTLLAGGVLNAVLLPQIVRSFSHADGGRDYVDRLLTLAITAMLVVTLVVTVGAGLLVRLMTSYTSPQYLNLATAFALICMPQVFFYGLYTLFGQVLNARNQFGAYMWSPVLANVAAIAGLAVFLAIEPRNPGVGQYTPGMIWLLAGSATLGVIAQALALVIPLWHGGFRYRPRWGFRGVGLRTASTVAVWTFAGVLVSQIPYVISQRAMTYAAHLDKSNAGLVSYNSAFLLFVLPHSMVTVSVVTALFTRISHSAHRRDLAGVREQVRNGLRLTAVATVPITIGMLVLASSLTRTLFFSSATTPKSADAIALLLIAMTVGLVPYGLIYLVQRVFYAFENARTPFWLQVILAVVATLGNGVCFLLPGPWIAFGVALTQTVSTLVAAVVGYVWLRGLIGRLRIAQVVRTYVRLGLAATLAAVAALLVRLGVHAAVGGWTGAVLTLVVGGGLFVLCYLLLARAMRVTEIDELLGPIARRARRALPGARPI